LPNIFSTRGGSDDDENENGCGVLFVVVWNLDKKEFMLTAILQETAATAVCE
jgi:hypothetical protein